MVIPKCLPLLLVRLFVPLLIEILNAIERSAVEELSEGQIWLLHEKHVRPPMTDAETLEIMRKAQEVNSTAMLFQAIWMLYLIVQVLALMITPAICAKIIACARGRNEVVWFWVTLACPLAILVLLALGKAEPKVAGWGKYENRQVRKAPSAASDPN